VLVLNNAPIVHSAHSHLVRLDLELASPVPLANTASTTQARSNAVNALPVATSLNQAKRLASTVLQAPTVASPTLFNAPNAPKATQTTPTANPPAQRATQALLLFVVPQNAQHALSTHSNLALVKVNA
jgi:hypothetical protein